VWVSCWLKRHEPAAFLAAMLNSQPLGFYTPSQLVQDARRHHIEVRPIDVTTSDWDCTLEEECGGSNEMGGSREIGVGSRRQMGVGSRFRHPPEP
jgi:DNA polymerase III alpha subunit